MTRWTVHGEHALYSSEWVNLRLVDVELPDGARFAHHVVRLPHPAVGTIVHRPSTAASSCCAATAS